MDGRTGKRERWISAELIDQGFRVSKGRGRTSEAASGDQGRVEWFGWVDLFSSLSLSHCVRNPIRRQEKLTRLQLTALTVTAAAKNERIIQTWKAKSFVPGVGNGACSDCDSS